MNQAHQEKADQKLWKDPPFSMGKSTISMVIFQFANCKRHYQAGYIPFISYWITIKSHSITRPDIHAGRSWRESHWSKSKPSPKSRNLGPSYDGPAKSCTKRMLQSLYGINFILTGLYMFIWLIIHLNWLTTNNGINMINVILTGAGFRTHPTGS